MSDILMQLWQIKKNNCFWWYNKEWNETRGFK